VKIWRGLGTRIIVGSVLCGLLGLLVAHMLTRRSAQGAILAGALPYIRHTLETGELSRCQRAPETWSLGLARGARLDAYDRDTRISRNPQAPPLDEALYERLLSGEPSPVKIHRFGGEQGGAMLVQGTAAGPCSLVQVTWPAHGRRHSSYLLLGGAVIVMTLAAALGFIAVVRPVTRRIERLRNAAGHVGAQSGYISASDSHKDELGELSVILDQAHARIRADAGQLEERQKALEQYLSDVAHDLGTPISSLQIAIEQACNLSSNRDLSELLKGCLKDVVYLGGLTQNLRLACRLRDGWDPSGGDPVVDLVETVERVVARARHFAASRGMSIDVARPDAAVLVGCHPTAAEQAITNLVDNALSYGDVGGHVAVLLERSADRFRLEVKDDGPGVLPAELPRLGERTFRSDDARQRDPKGSGLGLAIVSEVCNRCGFTLSFAREEPRGFCVAIEGAAKPQPEPHNGPT
jgi:signal transduction histidine kinase